MVSSGGEIAVRRLEESFRWSIDHLYRRCICWNHPSQVPRVVDPASALRTDWSAFRHLALSAADNAFVQQKSCPNNDGVCRT